MSDNNIDREFFKKLSKSDIFLGLSCLTFGYVTIVDFFSIYEGKIAILYNIIEPFIAYFMIFAILLGLFNIFLEIDSENNKNIKNKRKLINKPIIIFSFIGYIIILYFFGFYKKAYYSVFETSQTIVINDYEVSTHYKKGRYYRISFYDTQNPDKCVEYHNNICIYSLPIKRKTHNRLRKLEPKSNPIRITFKDKAKVVMNIELAQNGL